MTIIPNGAGTPPSSSLFQTQPLTVAGAFLITVQSSMAAIFGVLDDANALPWLTLSTQALITAAAMSLAVFIALAWAARHVTSRAAPVLPENTAVGVTNGTGKVVAVATIPSAADAVANQSSDPSATNPGG